MDKYDGCNRVDTKVTAVRAVATGPKAKKQRHAGVFVRYIIAGAAVALMLAVRYAPGVLPGEVGNALRRVFLPDILGREHGVLRLLKA